MQKAIGITDTKEKYSYTQTFPVLWEQNNGTNYTNKPVPGIKLPLKKWCETPVLQ